MPEDRRGGVGLVIRDRSKEWIFKSTCFQGTNMVICGIIFGGKRTPIISAYLPPSTLEHLLDLEESLTLFCYKYSILLGYPNTDIGQSYNPRSQQITDMIMAIDGLRDRKPIYGISPW